MSSDSKVCPSCGAEYQAWATRCHDCDVSLDAPLDQERDDAPDDAEVEPGAPPADALRPVRVASLDWLRRLRDALAAAGMESWSLAEAPACGTEHRHGPACGTRVAVWVHADHLDRALEVDRAHARTEVPDLADVDVADDACPACGAACPPDAASCEACGIVFAE